MDSKKGMANRSGHTAVIPSNRRKGTQVVILIGVFSQVTTEIGRALTYSCLPGIRVRGIDKSTTPNAHCPPPSPANSTRSRRGIVL